jgi:uncharacterized protein (TIGR03435 family)
VLLVGAAGIGSGVAQDVAGPKLAFEVASVRENRAGGPASSNFPLGPGPEFSGEVGLLTARNVPLLQLLVFAYAKNMYQIQGMRAQLPDWARQMRFDVQARAEGSPTKGQMRLMMQSLLEDRFGLKVHTEMREVPVFGLVLVKPGKLGERLRVHTADEAACSKEPPSYYRGSSAVVATVAGGYPAYCGAAESMPASVAGAARVGARDVTMAQVAVAVGGVGNVERPVLDRTGLTGTYDMLLEFVPENPDPAKAAVEDAAGPSLATALKDQLGLRMEAGKGSVEVVVLYKVEKLTEN